MMLCKSKHFFSNVSVIGIMFIASISMDHHGLCSPRIILNLDHAKRPLPLIVREKKNEPVYGNVNTTDSPITALLAVESLPGIVKQMANGNSFEPEFKVRPC